MLLDRLDELIPAILSFRDWHNIDGVLTIGTLLADRRICLSTEPYMEIVGVFDRSDRRRFTGRPQSKSLFGSENECAYTLTLSTSVALASCRRVPLRGSAGRSLNFK